MFGLVEFLGGTAWTAAVFFGSVLAVLWAIHQNDRRHGHIFSITLWLTVYGLFVLAVRGLFIWWGS